MLAFGCKRKNTWSMGHMLTLWHQTREIYFMCHFRFLAMASSSNPGQRQVLSRRLLVISARPQVLTDAQRAAVIAKRGCHGGRFVNTISSSSSSSSESDAPLPPPTKRILPEITPSTWEWEVSPHVCKRSGVMHFPKGIGKQIPDSVKFMVLRHNRSGKTYNCSVRISSRSREEKWLAGQQWLAFVREQKLKPGDVLRMQIRGTPLTIFVDVVLH